MQADLVVCPTPLILGRFRRCDELDLYTCWAGFRLQGGKRAGGKSGMQVRRGAFRRFDAALHGLLGIATYRTQEGQRRRARGEDLLIRDRRRFMGCLASRYTEHRKASGDMPEARTS